MIGYDELKEIFNLTAHKDEEIAIIIDATEDNIAKGIFGNIVDKDILYNTNHQNV